VSRTAAALAHVASLANGSAAATLPGLASTLRERAVLTVTFHPDRSGLDGRTAAAALADDGGYRTQFETGTSSGGLDGVLRGARTRWEHSLFGGAYDDAPPADRPRYGVLDLLPHPDGGAPRFGSTHLRLRAEVLERSTFSWGDSVTEPTAVGTWDLLDAVMAAAADDGAPELAGRPRTGADRLDGYIEAQIHGGLRMTDVESVVTDPSYLGTAVGDALATACDRFGATLRWHAGFELAAVEMDPAFRGEAAARLAHDVAHRLGDGDSLDPEVLGRAAAAIAADPAGWSPDRDPVTALQHLKFVWHHLAAFGYRG
jgi:hypothetical protein